MQSRKVHPKPKTSCQGKTKNNGKRQVPQPLTGSGKGTGVVGAVIPLDFPSFFGYLVARGNGN